MVDGRQDRQSLSDEMVRLVVEAQGRHVGWCRDGSREGEELRHQVHPFRRVRAAWVAVDLESGEPCDRDGVKVRERVGRR